MVGDPPETEYTTYTWVYQWPSAATPSPMCVEDFVDGEARLREEAHALALLVEHLVHGGQRARIGDLARAMIAFLFTKGSMLVSVAMSASDFTAAESAGRPAR